MKPQGICPACEQHVEWSSVAIASGIAYRCNNCWHHLTGQEIARLAKLQEELDAIAAKRRALLDAHRGGNDHAPAAKNR